MSGAVQVLAPCPGRVVAMADVPDPVFAEEMVGPGVAIEPEPGRTASMRPRRRPELAPVAPPPNPSVKVHLVVPHTFQDAKTIADRFKDYTPVILNLQGVDSELSKRLIDFASGLTYALEGGMQRIADKVFLLTPANVEVIKASELGTRKAPAAPCTARAAISTSGFGAAAIATEAMPKPMRPMRSTSLRPYASLTDPATRISALSVMR